MSLSLVAAHKQDAISAARAAAETAVMATRLPAPVQKQGTARTQKQVVGMRSSAADCAALLDGGLAVGSSLLGRPDTLHADHGAMPSRLIRSTLA